MKILSILNISNPDDLMCDSGMIFQRILTPYFLEKKIDYVLLGPDSQQFKDFLLPGVRKCYANIGTNRYSSRFNFDWDGLQEVLVQENPDVIFNCQIEITAAIRALLVTIGRPDTRLISYCHYPAIWDTSNTTPVIDNSLNHKNLGLPVVFDILGALLVADAFVIQSAFAKSLIESTAKYHRLSPLPEIRIVPPPIDPLLIASPASTAPQNRNVFYNHRLYQSYGTDEFLTYIESLSSLNFKLVVSDPMPNRSSSRTSLSPTPTLFRNRIEQLPNAELINGNVSREAYRATIQNSRLAFAAFRKACVWSMAALDCMGMGVPVIAPHYASYPEFIPPKLLFKTSQEGQEIIQRLLDDDLFWLAASEESFKKAHAFHPKIIAENLYQLMIK